MPPAKDLTTFKLLSFDIYGTLIDWEAGIKSDLSALLDRHAGLLARGETPATLLDKFAEIEIGVIRENPTMEYRSALAESYRRLIAQLGISSDVTETLQQNAEAFSGRIGTWAPHPDTVSAMQTLKRHYKLAALSNVDRASFAATLRGPLQGLVEFDGIYTAQDIGSHKPDPRNFEYLIEHAREELGVEKGEILHVGYGVRADMVPAKAVGLNNVFIARCGGDSYMGGRLADYKDQVDILGQFDDLGGLAQAVERAFGGDDRG